MAVNYIQFKTLTDLFSPAVRAFGNIAIIGETTSTDPGATALSTPFTDPGIATTVYKGPLGDAIALAFKQTPGPTLIYGVRSTPAGATDPDIAGALAKVSTLDVQFVVMANTFVTSATVAAATATAPAGAILQLSDHVTNISKEDGKERMGVAMLQQGSTDLSHLINNERMVYIAHKCDPAEDAAAAVAGTIAGYEPSVSLLLKPVNVATMKELFTPVEITTNLNGEEKYGDPPAGKGVNWLTSPPLLPGGGIYMGEGYTGGTHKDDMKFIDIRRTVDDLSFRLKARLIASIGVLRISRSGLRSIIAQMEAILDPFVRNDIISRYEIVIPLLALLDKKPETLTPSEGLQIQQAETQRFLEVLVAVEYQAAIHRLAITLKFE